MSIFSKLTCFPSIFGRGSISTSQKVAIVSITAGFVLLSVLARYLRRRKTPRPVRRTRKFVGRRSRNSVRSPNDLISLTGSKASARSHRSQSPGGSTVVLSDRMSLASGSLANSVGGIIQTTALTPQQLGVMGMEALETVINYWEDALSEYQSPSFLGSIGDGGGGGGGGGDDNDDEANGVGITEESEELCRQIQNLLDIAWQLQDKSELLFLDQRSVLFRNEDGRGSGAGNKYSLSHGNRSGSDPNFDSAESFASALDQVADLREFDEFTLMSADLQHELYQSALKHLEETQIPYRTMRTEQVMCSTDMEYLAKLHCIRLAFQYLFKDPGTGQWVADTGRQILTDILLLGDKDPKDFLVAYEDMMNFIQDQNNWSEIERELEQRNVKAMTFYDVVLDFIILDAFKDLDSPPTSVTAVVQNRFLSNGFKETALTTAVWSVLKAKRRMLKFSNGFMAHFYVISEQISPLMAWGFLGPDENLQNVCHYFKDQTMEFLVDIFNSQKCNYDTVETLSADIYEEMHEKVNNIKMKINLP